jgi:hypothetical protein
MTKSRAARSPEPPQRPSQLERGEITELTHDADWTAIELADAVLVA